MKRHSSILFALLLLSIAILGQQQNPYNVWCDYHSTYFHKAGQEFPSGKCYDVYEHTYRDRQTGNTRKHRVSMPCAR